MAIRAAALIVGKSVNELLPSAIAVSGQDNPLQAVGSKAEA
jgi:hypothetical protein